MMTGEPKLRPYQVEGVEFLVKYERAVLGDEMGLGKTRQVLTALKELHALEGRILLVCNGPARYVWRKEIKKWGFSIPYYVVKGQKHQRSKFWKSNEAGMFACTYGTFRQDITDIPTEWDVRLFDEGHNLHNKKTKNFKAAKSTHSPILFIITGSPIRKGVQNLWTLMHLIAPKTFNSYWRFVNSFCLVEQGFFGMEIVGPRNTKNLRKLLKTRLLRRLKRDVAKDMPPKNRQPLPVVLEGTQLKVYKGLAEEMLTELPLEGSMESTLVVAPTVLAKLTRLRQLLVTPKLFDPRAEIGAAFTTVLEHIADSEKNPHVVIFTPFAEALPHFEEALLKAGHKSVITFRGGMDLDDLDIALEMFKRTRGIGICSIKYAQSFDLDSASRGYFIGYEWDYFDNLQAEDRLQRLTTKFPVDIYYAKHEGTVDDDVLEAVTEKQHTVNKVFPSLARLRKSLERTIKDQKMPS